MADLGIDPGAGVAGGVGVLWVLREIVVPMFQNKRKGPEGSGDEEVGQVDRIVNALAQLGTDLNRGTTEVKNAVERGHAEVKESVETGTRKVTENLGKMYDKMEAQTASLAVIKDRTERA